ncbi:MAG: hypothetical protein AAF432_07645 [Planctomycetota bacterium]
MTTARRPTRVRTQFIASLIAGFVMSWLVLLVIPFLPLDEYAPGPFAGAHEDDWLEGWREGHDDVRLLVEHEIARVNVTTVDVNHVDFRQGAGRAETGIWVADWDKAGVFGDHVQEELAWDVHTCGWPVWFAYGRAWHTRDANDVYVRLYEGILPADFWPYNSELAWPESRLPFHIRSLHLIANTLFYAVIVWLLWFAPRYIRRWRRLRTERCIICAYPTKQGETCSECGTIATGMRWRGSAT